jgi:hypothetical protein
LLALCSPPAWAAQCNKETNDVSLGSDTAGLRSYVCRSSGQPLARVEFHRLNETSIGGLLKGPLLPPLQSILGNALIERNDLYDEVKEIFDRFATYSEYTFNWAYQLSVPQGGKPGEGSTRGQVWSIRPHSTFPLPDDILAIKNSLTFPRGFSFFYGYGDTCKRAPLSCTILWRYMTDRDAGNAASRLYSSLPGSEVKYDDPTPTDDYLKMLVYIAKGTWPKDLSLITGYYYGCDDSYQFYYLVRKLLLDVAVIENVSASHLSLEGLWGIASSSTQLRPLGEAGQSGLVSLTNKTLSPGQRLVVPLRFTLRAGELPLGDWEAGRVSQSLADARKFQKWVTSGNKNSVITVLSGIQKKRGGFGPPSLPAPLKDYVYGRMITLKGLVLNGAQLELEGNSANYVEYTMTGEGASCPYLYSWDDTTKAWDRHGKVIRSASALSKKTTDRVSFEGLKHRFQLREEELELTYLDQVSLTLRLTDGKVVSLLAGDPRLIKTDGDYMLLHPGESAELVFDASEVEPGEVKESVLAVTGYYKPYSTLLRQSSAENATPIPVERLGSAD